MMSSNLGITFWFAIGSLVAIGLRYTLWRRGLRLYGVIAVVVAIVPLLLGYWSDTAQRARVNRWTARSRRRFRQ